MIQGLFQGWLIGKLMKLPMWLLLVIGGVLVYKKFISGSDNDTGSMKEVQPVSKVQY